MWNMSKEEQKKVPEKVASEKKALAKVPAKAPARTVRAIRQRGPAASPSSVLATFDDMLEDFRDRFMENMWAPYTLWPMEAEDEFLVREAYSDLVDCGDKFIVRAEVPGIPKDKIGITVSKSGIEISGEAETEKEQKEKNYVLRERGYSSINKTLAFPEEVVPDKCEASVKDGVLEVSIPKKTPTPEEKKHKVAVK